MNAAVVLKRPGIIKGETIGCSRGYISAVWTSRVSQIVRDSMCRAVIVRPFDGLTLLDGYLGGSKHHIYYIDCGGWLIRCTTRLLAGIIRLGSGWSIVI